MADLLTIDRLSAGYGEAVVLDANGQSSFQDLQATLKGGRAALTYYAFDLLELDGERGGIVHLGEERMRADLGVIGLGHAEGVDWLHRDAGALEEFGRESVRSGDVG